MKKIILNNVDERTYQLIEKAAKNRNLSVENFILNAMVIESEYILKIENLFLDNE